MNSVLEPLREEPSSHSLAAHLPAPTPRVQRGVARRPSQEVPASLLLLLPFSTSSLFLSLIKD